MRKMIEAIISNLREKTKSNLFKIQDIQKDIRNLLTNPVSDERTAQIEERYSRNKILLEENNDFITFQKTLSDFYEKYDNSSLFNSKKNLTSAQFKNEKECFTFTVNNQIPFNEEHPYYHNELFFQKLLLYYQNNEDYEKCDMLIKSKQKVREKE